MTSNSMQLPHRKTHRLSWGKLIAWTGMVLLLFITLFPFYWMVRTGLTPPKLVFSKTTELLPPQATLFNFQRVLGMISMEEAIQAGGAGSNINFARALLNSVVVATLIAFGQVFFCSMAAFAFARMPFPGRKQMFYFYISGLMIPGVVTLIPIFVMMKDLNWLNTIQGIVAPSIMMSPFAVFFMRQFFLGVNRELEEAAMIDGASWFTIYFRVVLPLMTPAMTTLAIITFIGYMNEYLWPMTVARAPETQVLTVALGIFRQQTPQGGKDWTGLMAGNALATVPALLMLVFFGRRIVNSIQFTGIK